MSTDDFQKARYALQEAFICHQCVQGKALTQNDKSTFFILHSQGPNGREFTHFIIATSALTSIIPGPYYAIRDYANAYTFIGGLSQNEIWKALNDQEQRKAATVFESIDIEASRRPLRIPEGIPEIIIINGLELLAQQVIQATRALLDQMEKSTTDTFRTIRSSM